MCPRRFSTTAIFLAISLAPVARAQQPAITSLVAHAGYLEVRWTSPTNRNLVASAPSATSAYHFVSAVRTGTTADVSNAWPMSFFLVQRVAVVSAPDTNVAQGLRDALTSKWEPVEELYDFEAASVTGLTLIGRGITNLAGLEYTSLRQLNLTLNSVNDIAPLAGLTNLVRLDIGANQVSQLAPLAGLAHLTDLELYQNQVADLGPLSNLTGLVRLWLFDNDVNDLGPLAGLTNLTYLLARDNQVTSCAPLSGLARLQDLRLENNAIANVDALATLTNLTTLYLSSNQVVEIGALVTNAQAGGLGTGDVVRLQGNPLSAFAKTNSVPLLTLHGATVWYDP